MRSGLLLDTHIVVRWLVTPKKLSREQARTLRDAISRREPLAVSAVSLLEIAVLFGAGDARSRIPSRDLLAELESNPAIEIVPFTLDTALEVAAIGGVLRDPADRAIVATARVHRQRLVTSDQRIIESKLVPVIN
jgi:PIN domain nuclease of toxin-antitoxin system